MIELGDRVKDIITGFEGIAIARCIYLNGCVRIQVQAKGLEDGKIIESEWIDETQLDIKGKIKIKKSDDPGGPGKVPSKFSHP